MLLFNPLRFSFYAFFILGLLNVVFPWFFTYQGVIAGHKVSIRSLGDIFAVLLVLNGIGILCIQSARRFWEKLGTALETLSSRRRISLLLLGSGIFFLGTLSHKWRAHDMLSTHAFDLGFFSNICWNTSQGNWFFSSDLERNFMGVHVNWILWPLSFFYSFWPDARVLLTAQAVFMCAAIPLIGFIVYDITKSVSGGFLAALLFSCSPYFLHTTFNDFHPDSWQLPCLLASLWMFHRGKKGWLLFFALAALLAKEDVSIILIGFSVFLSFQSGWRKISFFLFALSVGVFLWHTQVFIPKYIENQSNSLLFSRYAFLGQSYSEMVSNLFLKPSVYVQAILFEPSKYWRAICMTFPVAGLTFFAPLYLLPPLISLMPHLLSQASTQLSLADIYSIPAQPFIFVGAAVAYKNYFQSKRWNVKNHVLAGICFVVAGWGVLNSPRTFRILPPERHQAFEEVESLVPVDASLATQQNLHPHFETRRTIQLFPLGISQPSLQKAYLVNPDYIFCDRIGNALPYNGDQLREAIDAMEKNDRYAKIFERENLLLFKRSEFEEPDWAFPPS